MGLLTALAAFQRWVAGSLKKHTSYGNALISDIQISEGTYLEQDNQRCKGWAVCYMEDLIIFSNSAEDHQTHLTRLLRFSRENTRENILIRRKMCLGLPICSILTLHSRQQRTSNGPQEGTFYNNDTVPEGTRGNQSFLALTGSYRKHIHG